MQISKRNISNLPSCKEYSRSKVTSHMPLKAVIFHRNVVQSPREECTAQRSTRRGSVLDWFCWCSPAVSLQPWSHTLRRRETSLGESTASAPSSLLPLPGQAVVAPPPVSLMMHRDGEVSYTRQWEAKRKQEGPPFYAHWIALSILCYHLKSVWKQVILQSSSCIQMRACLSHTNQHKDFHNQLSLSKQWCAQKTKVKSNQSEKSLDSSLKVREHFERDLQVSVGGGAGGLQPPSHSRGEWGWALRCAPCAPFLLKSPRCKAE